MFRKQREIQELGVAVLELLVSMLAAVLVSFISNSDLTRTSVFILSLLHILAFYISNYFHHFFRRGYFVEFIQTLKYSAFYALFVTFASFIMEEHFSISRRGLIYFILLNGLLVYAANILFKNYYSSIHARSKNSTKVFVITTSSRIEKFFAQIEKAQDFAGQIVAVTVVDEVFINLPSDLYRLEDLISQFEHMGIDVNVNINALDFPTNGEKRIRNVAGFNIVTFSTRFYSYYHVLLKRLLDIVGALFGLLLCGIAAIFLVPQIKKDGGPAIFSQDRVGKNGRIFKFYKFRSMAVDAEERKKELMAQNTMSDGMFKVDNDPRITPIGHFIRKTSLDELPQFWNVLKGDMSLVGTRPPTVDEYEKYTPEQKKRLSFKPGITGLWQVSGRSEITNFDDVVKLDVSYIDDWTIWSDIKILLKTVKVVLMKDGAK